MAETVKKIKKSPISASKEKRIKKKESSNVKEEKFEAQDRMAETGEETKEAEGTAKVSKPILPGGEPKSEKRERYFEAVGRRKTAVARVRLFTKPGPFLVNEKEYTIYFPTPELKKIAEDALQKMKLFGRFKVTVKVSGGGIHAQAEALRHGLARCLVKFNSDFRKRLKRAGFLRRDPRMKERKKPGLKKARRAPQWQKR
jgi:small subunit ribosomal protein S9